MKTLNRTWFALKRAYPLFPTVPGGGETLAPAFLVPYYDQRRRTRSLPRAALDGLAGYAFRRWARFRAETIARQFDLGEDWRRDAARTAERMFADPKEMALFRASTPTEFAPYLRKFEHAPVNRAINPLAWRRDCVLRNKTMFHMICLDAGLPVPPLIALNDGARIIGLKRPCGAILAIKPEDGGNGLGVMRMNLSRRERAAPAELIRALTRNAGRRTRWIAQEWANPHPALAPIAANALPTIRLITIKNEHGAPEIVSSVLKFALDPDRVVDNRGGAAPIDQSGRLGRGCVGKAVGELDAHPLSGHPIAGLQIPDWAEIKELALKAHRGPFWRYTLIGWDIAATPDGPVLIEGNGFPCSTLAQRPQRQGLGETRYGALIAHHLVRVGAAADR